MTLIHGIETDGNSYLVSHRLVTVMSQCLLLLYCPLSESDEPMEIAVCSKTLSGLWTEVSYLLSEPAVPDHRDVTADGPS